MITLPAALNGRMPADQLVVVDTGPNGPQRLHVSVAPIWAAMLASGMPAGHLRSGYRDLAQQAAEVAAAAAGQTPTALPPGQSKHGLGLAADIDEPARSWAHAHATSWVLLFPLPIEPWHCELDQARIYPTSAPTPPAPLKELIMAGAQISDLVALIRRSDGAVVAVNKITGKVKTVTFDAWQTIENAGLKSLLLVDDGNGNDLANMDPGPFNALVDLLS
ncbi:MAG: hypothetical protein BGO37_10930 [Cellulomonas sp. 73-92]|uniref:hypothetical protein n=1 Tax=Cellulomonas sp. 73-92 TaxID=1895740 RepID=UPI000927E9B7|nr:hypothetical protein [Cellulomonas sp. 73-92]OJV76555.1 MAG: hypothetical protein BGO37_10930 [Cellulomonas sp. 73-92]